MASPLGSPGKSLIRCVAYHGSDFRKQEGTGEWLYPHGQKHVITFGRKTSLGLLKQLIKRKVAHIRLEYDVDLFYSLPNESRQEPLPLSSEQQLSKFKEFHDQLERAWLDNHGGYDGGEDVPLEYRLRMFVLATPNTPDAYDPCARPGVMLSPSAASTPSASGSTPKTPGVSVRSFFSPSRKSVAFRELDVGVEDLVVESLLPQSRRGSQEAVSSPSVSSAFAPASRFGHSKISALGHRRNHVEDDDDEDLLHPEASSTSVPVLGSIAGTNHIKSLSKDDGDFALPATRSMHRPKFSSSFQMPTTLAASNLLEELERNLTKGPSPANTQHLDKKDKPHIASVVTAGNELWMPAERVADGTDAPQLVTDALNELEAVLPEMMRFKEIFGNGSDRSSPSAAPRPRCTSSACGEASPSSNTDLQDEVSSTSNVLELVARTPAATELPRPGPKRVGLQIEVGSQMGAPGRWNTNNNWQPESRELPSIPSTLQQIVEDELTKVKELGRGQFGSVWLCKWRGVDVAVKELHVSASAKSLTEMLTEAATLASLRHPCIIAFYGVVVNAQGGVDRPASVTEFMRGGSLRGTLLKLAERGGICKRVKAAIALQAACGMEYLHDRRVVHFDLKCDNLLCDLRDLDRPVVKIGDLGLSKQKAATFVSGNMRGTLPWMAPELFPGSPGASSGSKDRVTEKVDVFSFGVVMWEIWTLGQQPYEGLAMHEVFGGILSGGLRPLVPDGCDAQWAELMESCWRPQAAQRPDFNTIVNQLDGLLRSWGSEPIPESAPPGIVPQDHSEHISIT